MTDAFSLKGQLYKRALLTGAAFAVTLYASGAYAAQAAAPAAPAQPEAALEEITVTAQRTVQQLQDVPMSVQALSTKQLELQGIASGQALTGMVPNLVVGSASSNGIASSVVIRGIPGVGLYVDGVWQPDTGFREGGIVEMQRVEVLRGPQGTLFGRNTNGGAINYVTVAPASEFRVKGGVEVGTFQRRFANVSVDIPLAQTLFSKWTVAYQDQGGYVKSLTNGKMYGGQRNEVLRGDLMWKPTDTFSLRLTGNHNRTTGTPAFIARFTGLQSTGSRGAAIQNQLAYNITMMNPEYGPYTFWTQPTPWLSRFNNGNKWTAKNNSWNYPGGRVGKWENDETEPLDSTDRKTDLATATATWEITPKLKFTNIASYLTQDTRHFDNNPAAPVYQWNQLRLYKYDYWSEEAHLEGSLFKDKVNFLTGVYFLKTRQRTRTYSWAYHEMFLPVNSDPVMQNGNNPVFDPQITSFLKAWAAANANTPLGQTVNPMTGRTYSQDINSWVPRFTAAGQQPANATDYANMMNDNVNKDYSVFANATWHITPKLDLQGGIRGAWNSGVNRVVVPTGAYRTYLTPMQCSCNGYGPGEKFGGSTVALSTNPYPGGVTATPMVTASYRWTDDIMTFARYAAGYTTGSTSFNTTLNQNITLDPEIVKDYEAGIRTEWFDKRLRFNLTGYYMMWLGKQISQSLTVGNTFAVVTTSGGKSRAQGFEAELDVVPFRGLELQASMAHLATVWLESGTQNIPRNTMWGLAPKWTFHLGAQYRFNLPNEAEVTLRGDYGYQSEYQRDSDPGRQLLQPEPGYGLINARIQYVPPGGKWNLQLWGTNLGDKAYVNAGTGSVYLFGVDAASLGERRMFGARLNFEY